MNTAALEPIPPSIPHEPSVVPDLAADPAYLTVYLETVADDGDSEEMRTALLRAAAAIRLWMTKEPSVSA